MPTFFRLISEYFWVIALAFGALNHTRARKQLASLNGGGFESVGHRYLKLFTVGVNLPWVVMGAGQLLGYTPTVWHYFRPQDENPFVIAWLSVVFVLSLAYAWWVLFSGGAEKVRDLNLMVALGQSATKPPSLIFIKSMAALGVLFFPVWLYMAASMNAPLPK
ncbi:hypothetical protein [Paucibacter sp. XJ19-41]|uniref:hypothetical protein n=1 Tax=Paucibacter sp. XJ19-41 TaxID=2927824 RepID=UPI00234A0AF2|nr:hypothetical protein [Paucibacter sp. XJ19-41]MDC6169925.1 hypothetical protein [Paucibacter sp. XJ19-41]